MLQRRLAIADTAPTIWPNLLALESRGAGSPFRLGSKDGRLLQQCEVRGSACGFPSAALYNARLDSSWPWAASRSHAAGAESCVWESAISGWGGKGNRMVMWAAVEYEEGKRSGLREDGFGAWGLGSGPMLSLTQWDRARAISHHQRVHPALIHRCAAIGKAKRGRRGGCLEGWTRLYVTVRGPRLEVRSSTPPSVASARRRQRTQPCHHALAPHPSPAQPSQTQSTTTVNIN